MGHKQKTVWYKGCEVMREISVVMNARVASTRIPQKMVRPFAGRTLIELAMEKLIKFSVKHKFLAARDQEILDLHRPFADQVEILPRSEESVAKTKGTPNLRQIFDHYKLIPTPYIMIVNPCFPFSRVETMERAMDFFRSHEEIRTMTAVIKEGNIFLDQHGQPINLKSKKNASTQWNEPIYSLAHMFHLIDRDFFLENSYLWDYSPGHPYLYEVPREECFDADEMYEFQLCEILYQNGYAKLIEDKQ